MDIFNNPFYILGATLRDDKKSIIQLAEDKSLLIDPAICAQARSDLTNPRKRLSAEIAWLPGIAPQRAAEFISTVVDKPSEIRLIKNIPQISLSNLLAASLLQIQKDDSRFRFNIKKDKYEELINSRNQYIASFILDLALAFDEINPAVVLKLINEERIIAGFPVLSDLSIIEQELSERRQYFKRVSIQILNTLRDINYYKIITILVETATENGEEQAPILLDDIVDNYMLDTQSILEEKAEKIDRLIANIKEAADTQAPDLVIAKLISELEEDLLEWYKIALPIQLSTKTRGIDYDASLQMAHSIRSLALNLHNEHGKTEFTQQLIALMQKVFAEVDEISERVDEDRRVLDEINAERLKEYEEAKASEEKWREEISYEADIGILFKKKLKISPEGIQWGKYEFTLDSITRIRWGGTRHSVNGIPTGTTYTIFVGNEYDYITIETRQEQVYINFVDRLWKAVGVRILIELLEGLHEGKQFRFKTAIIDDRGIIFEKHKWFGANEHVLCLWKDIVISNPPGTLFISKKYNRGLSVELSYTLDNNVHILDSAINALFKRGGERLSSLLSNQNDGENSQLQDDADDDSKDSIPCEIITKTWSNGDTYTGEWKDNKRNGQGTYTWANGAKYTGEWKIGRMSGHGKYTSAEGMTYVGDFIDGMFNGKGTKTWPSGNTYTGELKNNEENGQGKYTWPDGMTYVGEFIDGIPNGKGTKTWPNGDTYTGEWKDNEENGQGTYTWASGDKYTGEWRNGKRTGQGKYTWPDGMTYVGEFIDGKPNGKGTKTWPNGDTYTGEWKDDKINWSR